MILFLLGCMAPCDDVSPCRVRGGRYYTIAPDDLGSDAPTVVLMHGWNGTPTGYASKDEVRQLAESGLRVLLPEGKDKTWNVTGRTNMRDDMTFILRVVEDAQNRFSIDENAVYASGFSMGASMASLLGCEYPDIFAAIAPTSGGFFEPFPSDCQGPISVRHEHGLSDKMWPLEGRVLWEGFEQSAIEKNIEYWQEQNECSDLEEVVSDDDNRSCYSATCAANTTIEYCVHERGHVRLDDWGLVTAQWLKQSD